MIRLQPAVLVLPGLSSDKKKERAAALKTLREDMGHLHRYLVRGAAVFRNEPAYSKYVFSIVDELVAVCMSDNEQRNEQCLVLQRRFTKVPKSDKLLDDFVTHDADARARLDRLSDRIHTTLQTDRILTHEIAYASGTSLKSHQAYVTAMIEKVG